MNRNTWIIYGGTSFYSLLSVHKRIYNCHQISTKASCLTNNNFRSAKWFVVQRSEITSIKSGCFWTQEALLSKAIYYVITRKKSSLRWLRPMSHTHTAVARQCIIPRDWNEDNTTSLRNFPIRVANTNDRVCLTELD